MSRHEDRELHGFGVFQDEVGQWWVHTPGGARRLHFWKPADLLLWMRWWRWARRTF